MIRTQLTQTLGLRVPLVMGGMQWVGTPKLVAAATNAGALAFLTALTQPTPEALKAAIRETRAMVDPQIASERQQYGAFGVNITLLPAIVPPDYGAYARAAIEEGVRVFETAGNNRMWLRGRSGADRCSGARDPRAQGRWGVCDPQVHHGPPRAQGARARRRHAEHRRV